MEVPRLVYSCPTSLRTLVSQGRAGVICPLPPPLPQLLHCRAGDSVGLLCRSISRHAVRAAARDFTRARKAMVELVLEVVAVLVFRASRGNGFAAGERQGGGRDGRRTRLTRSSLPCWPLPPPWLA